MIIDVHAHAFPRLGTPCGDDPVEVQIRCLQHHTYFHIQGWRRKSDGALVNRPLLYDGAHPGISGMHDVQFRIGEFGRLEFTVAGEDYWLQWMPPSLQQMESPPEYLTACMDYVGVDRAVLCPTHVYGELNVYTSECVRRYPERFIGLAAIREWKAYLPGEIARLTRAVEELGLRGLHFTTESLFMVDYTLDWSGPDFEPLWSEVARLRIPIFWDIFSWGDDPWRRWEEETHRLITWASHHPDIPSLVTHALPVSRWPRDGAHVRIPDLVWELFRCPNVYVELILPGQLGKEFEYPYQPLAGILLQELYEELGPYKLIWGSDMPCVERVVTYRQSLEYLKRCEFLSEEDLSLIIGGNAARLLGLQR